MKKIKILAIDDSAENLTYFQVLIEKLIPTAEVFTALNSRKGIGTALKEDPDIIFIDVVMPETDGFELCMELKKDDQLMMIPVIFLTAYPVDSSMRIKALDVGAEAFLKKPINNTELMTLIRAMVKIKKANFYSQREKELLASDVSKKAKALEKELEMRKKAEKIEVEVRKKLNKSQTALINILEDLQSENRARKVSEEELKVSQTLLKEAQHVASIGHWELDVNTMVPSWSEEIFHIFGLDPASDEPSFAAHKNLLHPDDWPTLDKAVNKTIKDGKQFNIKFRLMHPERGEQWMHAIGDSFRDDSGKVFRLFGTAQDVTKQVQLDLELQASNQQLTELAHHIENVREEERKTIALNLHDDLGQKLTALNIDLAWLARRVTPDAHELSDKLISMQALLMETMHRVKQISSDLWPSILDDLGIGAALLWQANEFTNHTDITCKVSIIPEDITIPPEIAIQVFRVVQESLTNVMRHAEATRVLINLLQKENTWRVRVKDNGRGISLEEMQDTKSFGLMGMKERTSLCNGKLSVKGSVGKGTEVIIEIPIVEDIKDD